MLVLALGCGGTADTECPPRAMCPGAVSDPEYFPNTDSGQSAFFVCKCGGGVFMGFDVDRNNPTARLSPDYCAAVGETWSKAVAAAGGKCF